jgi:bacteriocin-like protein
MSDEKREALDPQSNVQPVNEANVSDELSDDELNNISGGDKKTPPERPVKYFEVKLKEVIIASVSSPE